MKRARLSVNSTGLRLLASGLLLALGYVLEAYADRLEETEQLAGVLADDLASVLYPDDQDQDGPPVPCDCGCDDCAGDDLEGGPDLGVFAQAAQLQDQDDRNVTVILNPDQDAPHFPDTPGAGA